MVKCEEPECKSEATYGFKFATPLYCKPHGDTKGAKPQYQICRCGLSVPRFKAPEDERQSCCSKCKTDNMENVVERRCVCKKHLPSWGMITDKRADYCNECKKEGMINLKTIHNKCLCKTNPVAPSFGMPGDKKPTCCKKCRKEGMINMIAEFCSCNKIASYGFKNDKKPTCCNTCKKEGMENIVTKKCPCGKVPVFGKPGTKKPTHCQDCKPDEYVNVAAKLCRCNSAQPCYALPSEITPICCVKCKTDDMIDVRSTKCQCPGDMAKQPVYGFKDDKKATCCKDCKKDGMLNIKARLCECNSSQPIFNYPSEKKPMYCFKCKKDGMVDVVTLNSKRACKGTFELQELGLKCPYEHRGKKKYDYYCTLCFERNFPLDPRTKEINMRTKELAVRDYLAQRYTEPSFIHNKELWTGQKDCTCRRRIDFRALYGNTLLCIEVDEEQHKYRNKQDEALRYDDLMLLHGGKFVFVRINPDGYRDSNKQLQNPPLELRLKTLGEEIDKQIQRIQMDENTELVEVSYLYFDAK